MNLTACSSLRSSKSKLGLTLQDFNHDCQQNAVVQYSFVSEHKMLLCNTVLYHNTAHTECFVNKTFKLSPTNCFTEF